MWNMPIMQTFKLIALIYTSETGEPVKTHEERAMIKNQQKVFKEVADVYV